MLVSKREQARESERASIYYLIQRDDATRYPEKLFKLTHFFSPSCFRFAKYL